MSEMYERIENLCKDRGVNMTAMCRAAGVPRSNLSDLKYGRTSALATVNLDKISKFFDVSMDYLLGNEETKKTADPKISGLRGLGYDELTPENKAVIDALIDTLLKSQSGGQ